LAALLGKDAAGLSASAIGRLKDGWLDEHTAWQKRDLSAKRYNHLARLIYAEAVSWKPTHLAELREYVDRQRRGHYLEGHAGEYIAPNWAVYQRESLLYADVEAYQDGKLEWSSPRDSGRQRCAWTRSACSRRTD